MDKFTPGLKWRMITCSHFVAKKDEYTVVVILGGFYPLWSILKDNVIIDEAQYHSPVSTKFNKELACKAQAEKYLNAALLKATNQ